ncbi:hypothetical protein CCHL11_04515 [Colletotrichum chlorophyti]|uniref:Uncharacterized protein n=1 Tax=Colletotrichum chlorophyti TaxID=708187 RepID=A0A1Q8S4E8_9PEZI|nr:hypothetical protein CCHL11_04515 [Colletotrichum chlorophyti]
MHFPTIIALLASVATVHSAAVAEPEVRAVAPLLKRQGFTPSQCAQNGLSWCKNGVQTCPCLSICAGANLPAGGCCQC